MQKDFKIGQKVEVEVLRETDLGFVVQILESKKEALLYHNEIFEHLEINQLLPAYIKKVRDDGAIDLILHPIGTAGAKDLGQQILENLRENNGYIALNAKSSAEEIHARFLVSRKKFKIALGDLYKKRLVEFTEEGTKLVNSKK